MSNYPRPTATQGSPYGLAHGTDQDGNAPFVPAASVSAPTTTTQCPPSTRLVRPGRKSFAEVSTAFEDDLGGGLVVHPGVGKLALFPLDNMCRL